MCLSLRMMTTRSRLSAMTSNAKRRSARESASDCLAKFRGQYIDGVDMSSGVTRRGTAFHRAVQLYVLGLWETKQRADYELATQAYHAACAEHPLPDEEWADFGSLWSRFTERFELPLEQFYTTESGGEFMGAQMSFDLVLVPDDSTLRIMDWKSHWRIPPQPELENSFQAGMYLAAARSLFPGFERYELAFDFIRYNQQITVTKTHAELDAFVQRIDQIDAALEEAAATGVYPATPGKHCNTCRLKCEVADRRGAIPPRFTTYEEAQAAIGEFHALNTRAMQLRASIAAYGEACGPIRHNGLMWAFTPKDSTVYPVIETVKAVEAAGVVPGFKWEMSASAVKPLLGRKYQSCHDSVKALARTSTRTEFGPVKIDDETKETE